MALDQLGRSGAAGCCARSGAEAHRPAAGRSRRPGEREPPRMADRRSRDHGRGLRDRADLHYEHHARSPARAGEFRGSRRDRVQSEAGEESCARGADIIGMPSFHRHRRNAPHASARGHPRPLLAGFGFRRIQHRGAEARGGERRPRRSRLHHLHQRHRRRAQGGAHPPRRHPPQPRRLHRYHLVGLRLGRRSVPVLPAREPCL